MTREEQRKARARAEHERHLAKVKKEKAWLDANPHILAQQEREKEELRKNRETLRMLKTMKEDIAQPKKKKPLNAFAVLMEDSEEEEEEEEEEEIEETETTVEVTLPKQEISTEDTQKKFVWADECDE
jgi:hypothetical protein